ncbi:uncharacterized protein BO88DRAFT_401547 [Aspergillus vadensis CBS 113365]|uniref:Uncharacterized protein n=1 Tax=Aspergillus vadensis (strain CBS 113365 / IMI 142717 / IBT 24658) TaxID=1448311 RepID=A0A319BQL6_ASPVC|nr:hypothetical protein BO88DRAFT_401547 [Aspergillus vadensis CBS 113365]PYH73959.1 hypothetical protein BO88DRAFT_401547 [Aspergillus vadensis CBS 113365]
MGFKAALLVLQSSFAMAISELWLALTYLFRNSDVATFSLRTSFAPGTASRRLAVCVCVWK